MGDAHLPTPVLLLVAATSRYEQVLDLGREQCEARFGAALAVSSAFEFGETDYYAQEMGSGLLKQFWAFHAIDPGRLAPVKRQTNEWEAEYAGLKAHPEPRPLNLDPGYLTLAKLVLASTKDHAHRIYLADGIFAEVTLYFKDRRWQHRDWTFPDYRRDDYQKFFIEARQYLKRRGLP